MVNLIFSLWILFVLSLKVQRCWSSHKRRIFYTNYDLFRRTYSPNTVAEETYNNWTTNDAPQSSKPSENRTNHRFHQGQPNYGNGNYSVAQVIRCPYGWRPLGPLCSTLSFVPAYTQCPLDFRRFLAGAQNTLFSSMEDPGFCQRQDILGVTLKCPEGYASSSEFLGEESPVLDCRRMKVIPFAHRTEISYVLDKSFSNVTRYCPLGFSPQPERGGCVGFEHTPPDPSCPEGYELKSKIVDPYAFMGKESLICERLVKIKGKLWCPKGYEVTGSAYRNLTFGEVITSKHKPLEPFEYTPQALTLFHSGWRNLTGFAFPDEKTLCFQVLVVQADDCDTYHCSNAFLKELYHQLTKWSYHQLLLDSDYVTHVAIPDGRDFRMTLSGFHAGK